MRKALPTDTAKLVELMAEFYAEAGYELNRPHADSSFATLLADERFGYVWFIQSGDNDVGYIVLTLKYGMEYGGLMACVDDFFIRSPFRNTGLGTAALQVVCEFCKYHQIRAVSVEVGHENGAAQTVYRREGFVDLDRQFLTLALANPTHIV
jgi:GNAT superfamily N-acetyltransferase